MGRNALRNRYQDDVRGEITRVALRQLATGGPAAISVNAIGHELGVSGPAIYRYFAGRNALLAALIVEAYDDLAAAMAAAVGPRRSPRTRLTAAATAYREWGLAEPHRYRLLFRAPLPGYDPNAADLVRAAESAMRVLVRAVAGATLATTARPDVSGYLTKRELPVAETDAVRTALVVWSRLHGLVELEIDQVFASMDIDPAPLYADALGLSAWPT